MPIRNKKVHSFSLDKEVVEAVRTHLRRYNMVTSSDVSLSQYVNILLRQSIPELEKAIVEGKKA